jgi:hypothetical protein
MEKWLGKITSVVDGTHLLKVKLLNITYIIRNYKSGIISNFVKISILSKLLSSYLNAYYFYILISIILKPINFYFYIIILKF